MCNKKFKKDGANEIQGMIDMAVKKGDYFTTVTGNWEIEKTVLIPSGFTLILENCHLRMADGTFCNMFTNVNCRTPEGRTKEGKDSDIRIEGRGRVILDGGEYNGLSERTYNKEEGPHVTVNCILLFANVDGFSINNIHIRNQRYWGMAFYFCRNGKISNIDFMADCTYIDENNVKRSGLSREFPLKWVWVENADGIDIRSGCHDIIIENITGFTQDDTIALTGLYGGSQKLYEVEGHDYDIYNIVVRNVMTSSLWANVRLLNQGGVKLYNVLIDTIVDTSRDCPCLKRGSSGVRIGDHHMYGTRHATSDEIYNITVRNVISRAIAPLNVVCEMKNFTFDNIMSFDAISGEERERICK